MRLGLCLSIEDIPEGIKVTSAVVLFYFPNAAIVSFVCLFVFTSLFPRCNSMFFAPNDVSLPRFLTNLFIHIND